jgi:hypothetical protein
MKNIKIKEGIFDIEWFAHIERKTRLGKSKFAKENRYSIDITLANSDVLHLSFHEDHEIIYKSVFDKIWDFLKDDEEQFFDIESMIDTQKANYSIYHEL